MPGPPATNAAIYVNRITQCSGAVLTCDFKLMTDSNGHASLIMFSTVDYCLSLSNPNVSRSTVVGIPHCEVGLSGIPYLVSDVCGAVSANSPPFYLAY